MTPFPRLRFSARVISGAGRGKGLTVPTINLDMRDVPPELPEGVFACRAIVDGESLPATMHHGPRPTFGDVPSCEVHVLDRQVEAPDRLEVETVEFLREIEKFPTPEALRDAMRSDIDRARAILRG